jgi:hypothetical protein
VISQLKNHMGSQRTNVGIQITDSENIDKLTENADFI